MKLLFLLYLLKFYRTGHGEGERSVNLGRLKKKTDSSHCELTGKEVVVSGEYAVLTFHTDHNVQKKGFRIFFSAISGKCCGKAA